MARNVFYGQNTGRENVLVCAACLVLCHQDDDRTKFYQMHSMHLGKLNTVDKSLAIFKAHAKELKAAIVHFKTPGLPAIPRPLKWLDNTVLSRDH